MPGVNATREYRLKEKVLLRKVSALVYDWLVGVMHLQALYYVLLVLYHRRLDIWFSVYITCAPKYN